MISRVSTELEPVASSVTAIGLHHGEFEDLGLRTLLDEEPGLGPLGGLCRALDDAASPWVLVTCCDMLGLRASWVERLFEARKRADAVVFGNEQWHPFPGLYHRDLLGKARSQLTGGDRSMRGFLAACRASAIAPPSGWDSVVRIDRAVDLETWKARGGYERT
jgi:molybdopterin-guanine dinucleotide biosynthesis protein A